MIGMCHSALLRKVFQCHCGSQLLMFGCENPKCDNYYVKRLKEDAPANIKEGEQHPPTTAGMPLETATVR